MKIHPSPLAHFDRRPPGMAVDTIVIHSMYVPDAPDPYSIEACIRALDSHKVAAHYMISRRGKVVQCVEETRRAWHAGTSVMPFSNDRRENVNHFSIGIELIGKPEEKFSEAQYKSLTVLIAGICGRHPITAVVGHDMIAPGRKVDPGSAFDWQAFSGKLHKLLKTKKLPLPRFVDPTQHSRK